jgi:hypothetical protein
MMLKRILGVLLACAACASFAHAQTWIKVAGQSSSATVMLPAGTIYRWGSGTSWCDPVTVAKATTFKPITSATFPCTVGGKTAKVAGTELDVQEAASQILVTVNGEAVNVTVPALGAGTTTSAAHSVTLTYSIVVNADGSIKSSSATAVPH